MKQHNGKSLISRINRAFLLQAGLIAIAAMVGVLGAKVVIEQILIRNAIFEEEEYFWSQYTNDQSFPLPDTLNLTGYFDPGNLPEEMRGNLVDDEIFQEFGTGIDRKVLHVSERNGQKLYLIYYRGQVDLLVLYYGIFPLFIVLLILYLSLWMMYRFNRRAVSPVIQLANRINDLDLYHPDFSGLEDMTLGYNTEDEISKLADAIVHLGERLNDFIERERYFTRDASHELRSPLTVINLAADLLESEQELSKPAKHSVERIKRAITDMERLSEVFLLLAREDAQALSKEFITLNDILEEEIERGKIIKGTKAVTLELEQNNEIRLTASDTVLSVIFGNLIRNAINHTDSGNIRVIVNGQQVIVSDEGRGMDKTDLDQAFQAFHRGSNVNAAGFGIGLTIVKRLIDRFDWTISVTSEPGRGTRFKLLFPDADIRPLDNYQHAAPPRVSAI